MSNPCCPSNGSAWDTPVPGAVTLVAPGTQVLATPTAYPCGCGCGSTGHCGCGGSGATGVTGGATPPPGLVSIHPVLRQPAEVPAIGGVFQIYSTGASQWAIAGMRIWFPPFGFVEITGVTGDLVTVKNIDIPPGTVLGIGTPLIGFPPPAPVVAPPAAVVPVFTMLPAPQLLAQISTTPPNSTINQPGTYTLPGKKVAWLHAELNLNTRGPDAFPTAESSVLINGFVMVSITGGFDMPDSVDVHRSHRGVFPVAIAENGSFSWQLRTSSQNNSAIPANIFAKLHLLGSE